MNAKIIYSIGASLRQPNSAAKIEKAIVYGAVNKIEILPILKKSDVTILQGEGQITRFNSLILGLAKEYGIDAVCILGEIDNPKIIQPKTAQAILQVLIKILGITNIDIYELKEEEKHKKFVEQQMSYLQKVSGHSNEPPGIG
jgi:proteasome assembly chaperone (PAC2) family protein